MLDPAPLSRAINALHYTPCSLHLRILVWGIFLLRWSSSLQAANIATNSAELASALVNQPNVTEVILEASIKLLAEHFGPDSAPLTRDVVVEGASRSVVLDLEMVKQKVCLPPGGTLTFSNLTIKNFRSGTVSQTPGFDLLAPSPPPQPLSPPTLLVVQDCMLVLRWCYPPLTQAENLRAFQRPDGIPGRQNYTSKLNQTGACSNSTSAPPEERCWKSVGMYWDLALYGADLGPNGVPVTNNYQIVLRRTKFACADVLSQDCVQSLGPLGCYYYMQSPMGSATYSMSPAPWSSEPPPPPGSSASRQIPQEPPGQQPGQSAGSAAGGDAGSEGGGGASKPSVLAPVLAGVLGGVAVLAVLALGSILLVWRRRGLRKEGQPDLSDIGDVVSSSRRCKARSSSQQPPQDCGSCAPEEESATESLTAGTSALTSERASEALGTRLLQRFHQPDGLVVVVSPFTPLRPDLALGVGCGNEVTLLPVVRGKGSFGRVVEGMYGGQRVAVKLLPRDVLGHDVAPVAHLQQQPQQQWQQQQWNQQPRQEWQQVQQQQPGGADEGGGAGGGGGFAGGEVATPAVAAVDCGGDEQGAAAQRINAAAGARELANLTQEVEILGRCQHPNVVRLLAACLGPPQPCLVMELMSTSLDKVVHAVPTSLLPLQTVLQIALDIAKGLEYLHPTIVHRDLKPANVLVDMSGPVPVAKLSDFGLSRLRSTALATRHPEAGTPAYMAPECFDTANLRITHMADCYSWAVVVWEMLTGVLPWWGCPPVSVAYTVTLLGKRLPLCHIPHERCPPKLRRLLTECWDAVPSRRPAAAEVVKGLRLLLQALECGGAIPNRCTPSTAAQLARDAEAVKAAAGEVGATAATARGEVAPAGGLDAQQGAGAGAAAVQPPPTQRRTLMQVYTNVNLE